MSKKALDVSVGQHSIAGVKEKNQDFHGALTPEQPALSTKGAVIAIADGISSSKVSQIASETAIKSFLHDYYSTPESWSVKTSAQRVLSATNSWLYAQSQSGPNRFDKDKGYVCTFSALILKSNTAHLLHSGDSRVYRLEGDNLEQLTTDHRRYVTEHESYLTRALGIHNSLEFDYKNFKLSQGDIFILATDGVYEYINEQQLVESIVSNSAVDTHSDENLDKLAQQIINRAVKAGSDDNLTLQIVKVNSLPDLSINEFQQQIDYLPLPPTLKPRMEIDGYKILREIYISSRSHVFLAQDIETQQQVVLKTPSTEMRDNTDYLESLLMEDWIAKRINSANVLKAIEPNRARQFLYTVTEFINGQTLEQWMLDNPKAELSVVRDIGEQIANGLQAFHRQEMVHQDLRPKNIMIDESGVVKIIDFGSTKVAGISEIVQKNEGIVGTLQYSAPEYFLGELGDNRADIFSLGVITYQMLSGELPYGGNVSRADSVRAQQRLNYQSLITKETTVPAWIDYTLSRAVQVSPIKRYTEVSEFIYELNNPNRNYLKKARAPLIERNPVLFWQGVSFLLLCLLIWQTFK